MILLDTHILLWWTLMPAKLNATIKREIAKADEIGIFSLSFWEIAQKTVNGKLSLPLSVEDFLGNVQSADRVQIVSPSALDWIHSAEMAWTHKDPVDRVFVASARRLNAKLVTADRVIRKKWPALVFEAKS